MRLTALIQKIIILAALFAFVPMPAPAQVSVGVAINIGPPALPVYVQPPVPAPNMVWQPGFWSWGPAGYYWVPGTWVNAPRPGYLWTPGYWNYTGGGYGWHPGYWATHVGFYGGINYGFGYFGVGFFGGQWRGNAFAYNTAFANVNRTVIRNVYVNRTVYNNNTYNSYNRTFVNNGTINRTSYNGGPGGVIAQPSRTELAVAQERHFPATAAQVQHARFAGQDRAALATVNQGRPAIGAVGQPLSRENRPVGFAPIQPQDRRLATQSYIARPLTGSTGTRPYVAPAHSYAAPVTHAYAAPVRPYAAQPRPAYARPANANPAYARPENVHPAYARPTNANSAYARPANVHPAYARQATTHAAYVHPASRPTPDRAPRAEGHERDRK